MEALAERLEEVIARLQAIETELHHLREERTVKEWYGTAEVASLLSRSDYTVREWCRKRQIPAEKTSNGRDWIVVSLKVRPGNSGGPLVDVQGRLIGINTLMTGPQVGVAIPVHVVKAFLKQELGSQVEAAVVSGTHV